MKLLAMLLERLSRQELLKLQQDVIDEDYELTLLSNDKVEVGREGSKFKLELNATQLAGATADKLVKFFVEHEFYDAFKEPKTVDGCKISVTHHHAGDIVVNLFMKGKGFFQRDVSRNGFIMDDNGQLKFKLYVRDLEGFATYERLPLKSTSTEWAKIMVAQLKHQLK